MLQNGPPDRVDENISTPCKPGGRHISGDAGDLRTRMEAMNPAPVNPYWRCLRVQSQTAPVLASNRYCYRR